MKYLELAILAILTVAFPILASATAPIKRDGEVFDIPAPKKFVVTLNTPPSHSTALSELTSSWGDAKKDVEQWEGDINGFATWLTEQEVLKLEESSEVDDIEEDGEVIIQI